MYVLMRYCMYLYVLIKMSFMCHMEKGVYRAVYMCVSVCM